MSAAPPILRDGVPVALRDVEHELARCVRTHQGGGEGPLRVARMSNLVVFCDDRERAQNLADALADVVAVHPARAILALGRIQAPDEAIAASIAVRAPRVADAWSDVVALSGAGDEVARMPSAIRGLLIGDLPINVWWASNVPPPLAGPLLRDLCTGAQQIIYDSYGWLEPVKAMALTARWLCEVHRGLPGGRWRVASDLNWRRLKYWRRLLAESLDPTQRDEAYSTASEVIVEHGPHAVIQAWSLASWLARLLGWTVEAGRVNPGVEIAWTFGAAQGQVVVRVRRLADGPGDLRQVRVRCRLRGAPATLVFRALSDHHLEVSTEGLAASALTLATREHSYGDLVGRQLCDRERDEAFIDSTATSEILAQSLLH